MIIDDNDKLALERVLELIREKMEGGLHGYVLVPMKNGKIGKVKVEEILDVNKPTFGEG